MVNFFRNVLNGPLYIVVVILSIIFIMAIIGFIMERKQKQKEARNQVAFVSRNVQPINNNSEEIPQNKGEINQ